MSAGSNCVEWTIYFFYHYFTGKSCCCWRILIFVSLWLPNKIGEYIKTCFEARWPNGCWTPGSSTGRGHYYGNQDKLWWCEPVWKLRRFKNDFRLKYIIKVLKSIRLSSSSFCFNKNSMTTNVWILKVCVARVALITSKVSIKDQLYCPTTFVMFVSFYKVYKRENHVQHEWSSRSHLYSRSCCYFPSQHRSQSKGHRVM